MQREDFSRLFNENEMDKLFPRHRADTFFGALLGDPAEGAYDIVLRFSGATENRLDFEFRLLQRPGKCLACNLTYGLPSVFHRHPVIDLNGVVHHIASLLNTDPSTLSWRLESTREISNQLHVIPLVIHQRD